MLDKLKSKVKTTVYSFVVNGFEESAKQGKTMEMNQLFISASKPEQKEIIKNALKQSVVVEICGRGHYEALVYFWSILDADKRILVLENDDFASFRAAVSKGHKDVVEELLILATPNQKFRMLTLTVDGVSMWPFVQSVKKCRTKLVKLLLKADENLKPKFIDHSGPQGDYTFWAFRFACQQGQRDMVETLHKYANFTQRRDMIAQNSGLGPFTPFIMTAQGKHLSTLETVYNFATHTAKRGILEAWLLHKKKFGLDDVQNNDEQTNQIVMAVDMRLQSLVDQDSLNSHTRYVPLAKSDESSSDKISLVPMTMAPHSSNISNSYSILIQSFEAAAKDGQVGDMKKLFDSASHQERLLIQKFCHDNRLFLNAVHDTFLSTARFIYLFCFPETRALFIQQLTDLSKDKGKSTMCIDEVGKLDDIGSSINIPEFIESLIVMEGYSPDTIKDQAQEDMTTTLDLNTQYFAI